MTSLDDPRVSAALARLHAAAAQDSARWERRRAAQAAGHDADAESLVRMGELYLAVSPDEGRLLYLLARQRSRPCIVEFGASYGVSTLYLAAAARDAGGHVFTTEVHPDKCRALRETLAATGLEAVVTLLEGDARETLTAIPGPLGLVLLDGWKSLYLPVLGILEARLAGGALVVADNVDHPGAQDYLERVTAPGGGYLTARVGDLAISGYHAAASG
jgi:predicted O-methyltransferase YrrM